MPKEATGHAVGQDDTTAAQADRRQAKPTTLGGQWRDLQEMIADHEAEVGAFTEEELAEARAKGLP